MKKMKFVSLVTLITILFTFVALGVSHPSPATDVYAIRNAHIITVSGPTYDHGTIVMEGGKITAVGDKISVPSGAKVIDAAGAYVYPGMVDADTELGLTEIDSVAGSVDTGETGEWNSNIKTYVAINAHSELIPVTRVNGVLAALAAPNGGTIAGQSVLFNLNGWTIEDMVVKPTVGMHINFPGGARFEGEFGSGRSGGLTPEAIAARNQQIDRLKKELTDARTYLAARDAEAKDSSLPKQPTNLIYDNLASVLKGEMPVIISADSPTQIKAAITFAEEMKLKPIIMGGAEAWRVAPLLKQKDVPVIVVDVLSLPRREDDSYDAAYANASVLQKAGVRFCIATGGASSARDLPYHAGMASAFGLPKDEALKSVTLYPAQILGVGDKLGSLEEGKIANVVVADGDMLEIRTQIKHIFIAGKPVSLETKHTDLYDKFIKRP